MTRAQRQAAAELEALRRLVLGPRAVFSKWLKRRRGKRGGTTEAHRV